MRLEKRAERYDNSVWESTTHSYVKWLFKSWIVATSQIGLAGVAVNVEQSGGTLELGNLEDGTGARVRICWPLALLDELERCEAEERAWLVQLAERMIVLPEVAR